MNWGYKIALAYGSFVIMMLYFIFVASKQSNELVEEHYYEKELQFQNVLNANANLTALNVKPTLTIKNTQLHITLPSQVSSVVSEGKIEFIRLSDKSKDISSDFKIDEAKSFNIPIEKFLPGIYKLHIQWKDLGIPYMFEDEFNFSKP